MSNGSKPVQTAPKGQRVKLTRSSKCGTLRKIPELFPDERTQNERNYGLTSCRLYNSKEVCEVLRISEDCFRKLTDSGVLRWHDVARKKLVQGCEIIRYLQNCLK